MISYDQDLLFDFIRERLKQKKISYKALGEAVGLSQGTIKKIFHQKDTSFSRLLSICEAIDLSFKELTELCYLKGVEEFEFSVEQETFLANQPHFFHFFRELFFHGLTPEEIGDKFEITEKSTHDYLKELEKRGFLERRPLGKISFPFRGRLKWIEKGPWAQKNLPFKAEAMAKAYLAKNHGGKDMLSASLAVLTEENLGLVLEELEKVVVKIKELNRRDELLYPCEELETVSWYFCVVPEEIDFVAKKPNNKTPTPNDSNTKSFVGKFSTYPNF